MSSVGQKIFAEQKSLRKGIHLFLRKSGKKGLLIVLPKFLKINLLIQFYVSSGQPFEARKRFSLLFGLIEIPNKKSGAIPSEAQIRILSVSIRDHFCWLTSRLAREANKACPVD